MPTPPSAEVPAPAATDVAEIDRNLNRMAHLANHSREHGRLRELAGIPLERSAVVLLRQIADSEPLRPGELANLLAVEASHITRQVQRLQEAGYVTRVPDPDDRRAQRIELTATGEEAVDRIRDASRRGMQLALGSWSAEELQQLAGLFHRMVDDFLAYSFEEEGEEGAAEPVPSA